MTDRELLELAAKAAEYEYAKFGGYIVIDGIPGNWNPLTDDGDALRLAVKLGILSRHNNDMLNMLIEAEQKYNLRDAATRRAIVLAAAEIGKEMK